MSASLNGSTKPPDDPQKQNETANVLTTLKGQVGQLGAIGIVCAAFWLLLQNNIQQASEDRRMFREAVGQVSEAVRKSGEEQAQAMKALANQIEQLSRRQP